MIRRSSTPLVALIIAMALALVGCAGNMQQGSHPTIAAVSSAKATTLTNLSDRDIAALSQLDDAAAQSAAVEGTVTSVDCWTPSEHMIGGSASTSAFRVICRVHYDQKATKRYKDMNCIGDFRESPMLDQCYRWAAHVEMPTFEDGPSLATPIPSPEQ